MSEQRDIDVLRELREMAGRIEPVGGFPEGVTDAISAGLAALEAQEGLGERLRVYEGALRWYANWQDNISQGVYEHGTEDGDGIPDMGRRAHDALQGIDVQADDYDRLIEASQRAMWGDRHTEEALNPYPQPAPIPEEVEDGG